MPSTPVQAFDENGTQVWQRELDIYGKARVGDSVFCPWGFQNQYYDEETGLAYNRFRYYDPGTGGYISQDPIGLAGNNLPLAHASRVCPPRPTPSHPSPPRGDEVRKAEYY